jgi:hypothetical protein
MINTEDNPNMKVLKTATCKTLSGKSTLTYQIGCNSEEEIHLRITKNSGGGFFTDEWSSTRTYRGILLKNLACTKLWFGKVKFQRGECSRISFLALNIKVSHSHTRR